MMNRELIPLVRSGGLQAVMGRDLHAFLEVSEKYTEWFNRMEQYGFVAGQDFIRKIGKSTGGRPLTDHVISLDMAKEISMIQRSARGKQARAYFLECERRARQVPELTGPELMAKALLEADSTIKELEARATMAEAIVEESAPIVAYHERFIAEDADVTTIDDLARAYSMSGPAVRKLLTDKKVAFRRTVGSRWSGKKGRMVDECEWRAYAGKPTSAWFELRPQHNAPRLHNGQVRQTLYVKTYKMPDLAEKLGLKPPVDESPGLELKTRNGVQALGAEKEKETGEIPWH